MVDVIVLAGGYSSRAKANKMTLEYEGKPLIMHTIETAHSICDRVVVVTGHYHRELNDLLSSFEYVKIIYNDLYEQGMFTSIKAGVKIVDNDFFIIPGDYPSIQEATYKKIIDSSGNIRVPSYNHKLGHPIFFKKQYKIELLETKYTNLKDFRNSHIYSIIDVDDQGIIQDIDDMEDYKKLLGKD